MSKQLLSGNEAIALGAYHAGVSVAAAYPGTPSTEILQNLAGKDGVYAEWSTNEKVALEVGMGASYAGVRTLVSMKHVGLNVAADPFFAASTTGVSGGFVIISADDPGEHSSQGEQDNRHYAKFAKVPMLEPSDSQEAYDVMPLAFNLSEEFDTPVLLRTTTRISHCKGVVNVTGKRPEKLRKARFVRSPEKYVMVPTNARARRFAMEERMSRLKMWVEDFPMNEMVLGDRRLGIVSSGVAYQYAREVFPKASFLKLVSTYPVPGGLVRRFAKEVERVIVVEELDPFLEEELRNLGISTSGKEYFPIIGEFSADVVAQAGARAGLLKARKETAKRCLDEKVELPARPPLLCPGCPHVAAEFALRRLGFYRRLSAEDTPWQGNVPANLRQAGVIATSDIGCYTLGVYAPLFALDTCACMGASIGQALGLEKAGVRNKVVAVIGDSTFMHSGITGLVDVAYNQGKVTVIILDNETTAMTGHQGHPATGISASGAKAHKVDLEGLVRSIVADTVVVNAFDLDGIETALRRYTENDAPSVIIARGACPLNVRPSGAPFQVDEEKCDSCFACLRLGCPAISVSGEKARVDMALCVGDGCTLCLQLCPQKAFSQVQK